MSYERFKFCSAGKEFFSQRHVRKLKECYMKEGPTQAFVEDAKETVVDWLKNHIKYSGKALGLFLKMKMQKSGS